MESVCAKSEGTSILILVLVSLVLKDAILVLMLENASTVKCLSLWAMEKVVAKIQLARMANISTQRRWNVKSAMNHVRLVKRLRSVWHVQETYFSIKTCVLSIVTLIVLNAMDKMGNALSVEKILSYSMVNAYAWEELLKLSKVVNFAIMNAVHVHRLVYVIHAEI